MSLTREQIQARKRGVGCSELLAALGKDPRCSRLELYMRKRGELPEPDLSDDERVRFGNLLEPVIRDEAGRRLKQRVIVPAETLFHPTFPLVGHPDGWMPALNEGLEVKTADKFEAEEFGEPDSDQVPIRYLVQCAGYMALTDADRWHLAVLIGGNDFRLYEIPRDRDLEAAILAGVAHFWRHVEESVPPEPATPEDVKLLWPKSLQPSKVATPDIYELVLEHAAAKRVLKECEAHEEQLATRIKQYMEDAGDLHDEHGKTLVTWRSAKPSQRFDAKRFATEHPELYAAYCYEQAGSRRFLNKMTKEVTTQ